MSESERPQIYLVTPPDADRAGFAEQLGSVLDAGPIACLRLRLASQDEATVTRTADALRETAHARDIPLVIDSHVNLVTRLGLDGVHLTDGARSVRKTRKALGADAIVGAACGTSRHEGLTAGEAGADYVSLGPVGATTLGAGETAARELFAWWSEMIELPIVAEGALDPDLVAGFADVTDFFALGDEVWQAADPAARLREFLTILG
jgi:thiamine-phosphate pyrophosphorylase